MKPVIVYISTNEMWSGSEELWYRSAQTFRNANLPVGIVTKFTSRYLSTSGFTYLNSTPVKKSLPERIISKIRSGNKMPVSALEKFLVANDPKLVVISQGNNIGSLNEMELCIKLNIPFVTITQLVAEVHLLYLNETGLQRLRKAYKSSRHNFFVSEDNLRLHSMMMGTELSNADIIYNPCRVLGDTVPLFPEEDNIYFIGLVGRIECFHKGYDILLEVLKDEKWKARNVRFNIYGDGPHVKLMQDNIERLKLSNVSLQGYTENIRDVWKHNHLLCMPSRMEGQALALLEAMYYSRCAVVTNVGGAADLIKDEKSGFVAESATVESFASALERAWNHRHKWQDMGKACHDIICKQYEVSAEEYLNSKLAVYLNSFNYS